MGTVNAERAATLYTRVIEALSDAPLQVIVAAPLDAFAKAPEHWIIQRRVPQLQVLAQVDAVFCHGGHNTTVEALSFGLPLIIAPIRDDQPVIAEQVKAVGAGIRVHFARAKPQKIRIAVDEVLKNPSYKQAAQAVRHEFMGEDFMHLSEAHDRRPTRLASSLGATRAVEIIESTLSTILEDERESEALL
jgi:UDP:flavonoid glycosyltransferase YjiC (YdhE family)